MRRQRISVTAALSALCIALAAPVAFSADSGGTPQQAPAAVPTPTPSTQSSATPTPAAAVKSLKEELSMSREMIARKDYGSARSLLLVTVKNHPNDPDVNNLLGFTSRKLKMYSSASSYYAKALSIDPSHKGALEYQGELYIETKKVNLAQKNLAKLKKICGTTCEEYQDLKKALSQK